MRRTIALSLGVVFVVAGCKSKKSEDGEAPGSGTGSAPGSVSGAAAIEIPGGDASAYIAKVVAPPKTEDFERVAGTYEVLKTVELGPDGTRLATPAIVTVTIDNLPAGRSMDELVAALSSTDGSVEDAKIVGVDGNQVKVEVTHFSILTVALLGLGLGALATLALTMRGTSDPILRPDCGKWINPSDPKVAALASDPSKFAVDPASGAVTLDLGKPLQPMNVSQMLHTMTASQVIDQGGGDCVNMSTLFGSLLAAKQYPVRQVAGNATYVVNGKEIKGGHQWTEVVIDRKTYYVDTFNPAQTRLIPIDQARSELSLKPGRMCDPAKGPARYDPKWFEALTTDDPLAAKKAQLETLKAEHRQLNADCQAGVAGACTDRQTKYEEAKKLQEEINAAEAAASP